MEGDGEVVTMVVERLWWMLNLDFISPPLLPSGLFVSLSIGYWLLPRNGSQLKISLYEKFLKLILAENLKGQ